MHRIESRIGRGFRGLNIGGAQIATGFSGRNSYARGPIEVEFDLVRMWLHHPSALGSHYLLLQKLVYKASALDHLSWGFVVEYHGWMS
jgi:hypothetical protein